jgi:hypothetical protein
MKKLGFALAGLAAVLMTGEAYAAPIGANGSFGFIPFGTVSVSTVNISTTTMDKVLPASEMVNTLTDPFMGQPDNLGVAVMHAVTLGYLTIPMPHPLGIFTSLATPLTVSVPTSVGVGGTLTFTYTSEETTALSGVPGGVDPRSVEGPRCNVERHRRERIRFGGWISWRPPITGRNGKSGDWLWRDRFG